MNNHRFIPELIEFRNKFNVHNKVTLTRNDLSELLECSNAGDMSGCISNFEPGTMYILHHVSQQDLKVLQSIVEADDGTAAKVFHETLNCCTTAYLCFKDLDPELLKKASDMFRSFVKENSTNNIIESEIRQVACSFIENCLYF
jgi:hypothetical protein